MMTLHHDRLEDTPFNEGDAASAGEVFQIPRFPKIGIGDIVTVAFTGKGGEKPQHTVLICEDPKRTDAPEGVQAIDSRSTLAIALTDHDPDNGRIVTFSVAGGTAGKKIPNEVEIIEVIPSASA